MTKLYKKYLGGILGLLFFISFSSTAQTDDSEKYLDGYYRTVERTVQDRAILMIDGSNWFIYSEKNVDFSDNPVPFGGTIKKITNNEFDLDMNAFYHFSLKIEFINADSISATVMGDRADVHASLYRITKKQFNHIIKNGFEEVDIEYWMLKEKKEIDAQREEFENMAYEYTSRLMVCFLKDGGNCRYSESLNPIANANFPLSKIKFYYQLVKPAIDKLDFILLMEDSTINNNKLPFIFLIKDSTGNNIYVSHIVNTINSTNIYTNETIDSIAALVELPKTESIKEVIYEIAMQEQYTNTDEDSMISASGGWQLKNILSTDENKPIEKVYFYFELDSGKMIGSKVEIYDSLQLDKFYFQKSSTIVKYINEGKFDSLYDMLSPLNQKQITKEKYVKDGTTLFLNQNVITDEKGLYVLRTLSVNNYISHSIELSPFYSHPQLHIWFKDTYTYSKGDNFDLELVFDLYEKQSYFNDIQFH